MIFRLLPSSEEMWIHPSEMKTEGLKAQALVQISLLGFLNPKLGLYHPFLADIIARP